MKPDVISAAFDADKNISARVEFEYFDAGGKRYGTVVCLTRLQTGAIQICPGSWVQ